MDSTTAEKNCVLCCQDVDIIAFGKCDHPVCYRCSTKMRVLCEQKYCAVCREELDKVVFLRSPVAFLSIPYHRFPCEKKHDIYFGDEKIYCQFRHLLLPQCPLCTDAKIFSKFEELEHHMRKQHELFCCKLCLKHLKIFSHERKWYNRKELARHRAHGDPDDTSHRGHPLCRFCDDRYLDNDELLKHLRRDHYFCHFCDADGSQEYYSDYQYLSEHFRESHYLCEEGRCATEQFTHAFRTEIDYKAHKAAAHSKNRAEARQNRQIDLEFTYAPRQPRRNEGEDYDDMRNNRGGRGRTQGGQRSWRYSRDEEDRELAAAMRASMATRRQEARAAVQERNVSKHSREERTEPVDTKHKPGSNKPPVKTMKSVSPGDGEDDFPALGGVVASLNMKPASSSVAAAARALKEDEFPSLSAVNVSTPMTPAYTGQTKKSSSFQDEDFPALVSKIRLQKPTSGKNSAWSSQTAAVKPSPQPAPSSKQPTLSNNSGHHSFPSSASSSLCRKKKVGENMKAPSRKSLPSSDEDGEGMTQQEFHSVPTMLEISSLLTVNSATMDVSTSKASKKKKKQQQQQQQQQKNPEASSAELSCQSGSSGAASNSIETAAQKENVPQKMRNKPAPGIMPPSTMSGLAKGLIEKSQPKSKEQPMAIFHPIPDLPAEPEEEFPALMTKKPPPGFKSGFPLKTSIHTPSAALPPPPPGLLAPAAKPPPGFTGIPLNSNVSDPTPSNANTPLKVSASGYLVPDNFDQRNLELIQSIRKCLNNDESKFNQFKNFSAQFRQGIMAAVHYHRSCKNLLGDNFNRIFNELLVLLPDTCKQQELLSAHGDCRALEKQSGGGKKNKNKKNVWQTTTSGENAAAELDCQVCQVCRQVLALKDFNSHKTLHTRESEDFPSLQSISKIIS